KLLLQPSPFESFSIVLLESLMMGTPVLVNGHNEVLAEHCACSGAGLTYGTKEEFAGNFHRLLNDTANRRKFGQRGQCYVEQQFSPEVVRSRLLETLQGQSPASVPEVL